VIAAIVAAFAVAAAPAAGAPIDRKLENALDRIVDSKSGPPGLSVLLKTDGGREFLARGTANTKTGRRPTAHDHYRIASIAKAFSGAVALSLVDRGVLSLDDTIGGWLPGALPYGAGVTVAQALAHTGGLPDYIKDEDFIERLTGDFEAYISPPELLEFVRDTPLDFPPGDRYHYSDTDNVAVGLIAEQATGLTYDEVLEALVYQPLGLIETSLPRTVRMPKPYMHGYELEPGEKPEDVSEFINPAGAWASGGIVSTPTDMGRFVRGYVGNRLFDPAVRATQTFIAGESQPAGPGDNEHGLALFRYRTDCGTVFGHTGSFPGYRAFAASSRNGKRSVVFTVNAQLVGGARGGDEISDLIRRAQRLAVCKILR
jgi:D-alanyl-D-alanine carboxypeptidase